MKAFNKYINDNVISNYIDSCYNKSIDLGNKRKVFYNNMSEYFNNDIPILFIDKFLNNETFDYVFENLQAHDYKKLQVKLKEIFSDKIEKFIDYTGNDKISSFFIISNANLYDNDEFNHLVNMYGYKVREYSGNDIFIEPIESYDVFDYLYKDCKGICYHFTDNNSADSILKSGLRVKNNTGTNIAKRIYLYATDKLLLDNKEKIIDFIAAVTNSFMIKKYGLAVLRIDLNQLNKNNYVGVYKDTAMKEKEAVYTLYNIPKECIKKIKFSI